MFTHSELGKHDGGGGGGKDCEWKKLEELPPETLYCFLSFAVDLLKLSYCKMCLTISIFYTV